jgi:hypothetical protein
VLFRARASSHADAESVKVSVDLASPDGKAVYYRGVATLMPELPPPARADIGDLAAGDSLDPERAYRDHLANGPELRLVDAIERIHEEGVDAAVSSSCPESWLKASKCKCKGKQAKAPAWLFDPGVTDTAPQLAAVWSHLKGETTPLPSHIGGVERFGALTPGERLRLRLRVKSNGSADNLLYDALFVDKDDRVRLVMRNVANTSGNGAGHDPGR